MNRRRVLIETSWNVKCIFQNDLCRLRVCINRNIVECKVVSDSPAEVMAFFVLIETSWNVKFDGTVCCGGIQAVLIETSWNVKPEGYVRTRIEIKY